MGAVLNIEDMLQALAEDAPCGADLDDAYDPEFAEFQRLLEVNEWAAARASGEQLFARTLDLRVAVGLATALLETDQLAGFADGLQLIHGLLERHWEPLHPRLDEETPPFRSNVLMSLSLVEGSQSGNPLHDRLRRTTLLDGRVIGRFSYRDCLVADGELSPAPEEHSGSDGEPPTTALLTAAAQEAELPTLEATAGALQRIVDATAGIAQIFNTRLGPASVPNLQPLNALISAMKNTFDRYAESRLGSALTAAPGVPGDAETAPAPRAASDRQAAIKALEQAASYFERFEPSSPVPLLIRRAQRLATMSFMEVLRDLTPDAIAEAERITGSRQDGE